MTVSPRFLMHCFRFLSEWPTALLWFLVLSSYMYNISHMIHVYPCMAYSPTFGWFLMVNVDKYTIHGSYGYNRHTRWTTCSTREPPWQGRWLFNFLSRIHWMEVGEWLGKISAPICFGDILGLVNHIRNTGVSKPFTLPQTNIAPANGWLEY